MTNHQVIPLKTIGILGGMSNIATVNYYKGINQRVNELMGGYNIAEIVMHSVNFANIEAFVRSNQWDDSADYLVDKALKLERAGADFILCVSNTMHRVAPQIEAAIKVPFLHIAEPTIEAIKSAKIDTIGLLGTLPIMEANYMRDYYIQRGIDVVVPKKEDMNLVDRIIFDELVKNIIKDTSKQQYVRIARQLEALGAQGIVLGCTEIETLLKPGDVSELPLFDTTALHVDKAAKLAVC
ncbi:aspartate/glutamate racemase family protein [Pleurocapsa sp. FMAR1]|uniref:aspartate/glutamate racemase family protein n=1 Tax=Pleurocapsa sp. FMAR1 TaxID=3040204 RepID=UPI0029C9824C|nr:amino acid racemase [Pleurocapsa sp. FMAR1]